MILFVEGARHCGKTFLINKFIENCNDPRLEYYKFYFADHIKTLDLVELDSDPSLHYFSLGNIMTIMEMNLRPEYRDKIWIFDRAIISAYT
jgi:predicted AAA+ superfamily ATPase